MKGAKFTGGIERFVKLPPGDTQDDDPPEILRNVALGYNYYYQGQIDKCLMGGFANAVSSWMGSTIAKVLLQTWSPSHHTSRDCWTKFQEHAIKTLHMPGKQVVFAKSKE